MTKEVGQEHDRLFREYISPRNPDGSLNEKLAQERMLGIYSARHEAHLQAERVRQQVMQTTGETVPVRPAGAYAGYVEEVRLARFMDQVAGAAEKGAYRNISLSELEKKVAGLMAEAETPGAQPAKHTRTAVRGRQNSSQMDPFDGRYDTETLNQRWTAGSLGRTSMEKEAERLPARMRPAGSS